MQGEVGREVKFGYGLNLCFFPHEEFILPPPPRHSSYRSYSFRRPPRIYVNTAGENPRGISSASFDVPDRGTRCRTTIFGSAQNSEDTSALGQLKKWRGLRVQL